jgi:hypothetical protein
MRSSASRGAQVLVAGIVWIAAQNKNLGQAHAHWQELSCDSHDIAEE